jgi:hypothetical protein
MSFAMIALGAFSPRESRRRSSPEFTFPIATDYLQCTIGWQPEQAGTGARMARRGGHFAPARDRSTADMTLVRLQELCDNNSSDHGKDRIVGRRCGAAGGRE